MARWRRLVMVWGVAVAALTAACGSEAAGGPVDASGGGDGGGPDATTYHGAARAVLERRCVGCHHAGGIGPFSLDGYGEASGLAPLALAAVEAGLMPPWPPADGCRDYHEPRRVTPEELDVLRAWVADGTPEGDPATHVPPQRPLDPRVALGEPALRLAPATAYTSPEGLDDDYHCFVLDGEFAQDTYARMLDVTPGNGDTVHHVIIFLVEPKGVAGVLAQDEASAGEGYTCFGGPMAAGAKTVAGWVPGQVPVDYGADTAIRVPAGSRLVMQVHYNLLSSQAPDPGTSLGLWATDGPPSFVIDMVGLPNLGILIAAGDPESQHVKSFPNETAIDLEVIGVLPHMHQLGKRISVTAVHTDGDEECLVDIPQWRFNWQQQYTFAPGDEVRIEPGAAARLECVYDNSAGNQAIVDGEQLTPRLVTWGEGTLDEMCLAYLVVRTPWLGGGGDGTCGGFDGCYQACRGNGTGLTACALTCTALAGEGCLACTLNALSGCSSSQCAEPYAAVETCVTGCLGGGDAAGCIQTDCAAELAAHDACVEPIADPGGCDGLMAFCDASLGLDQ